MRGKKGGEGGFKYFYKSKGERGVEIPHEVNVRRGGHGDQRAEIDREMTMLVLSAFPLHARNWS